MNQMMNLAVAKLLTAETESEIFKGVLGVIDVALADGNAALANVLTATRGIDLDDKGEAREIKKAFTGVIRGAAFPLTQASPNRKDDLQWTMNPTGRTIDALALQALDEKNHHFARHIQQAMRALGLEATNQELADALQSDEAAA